MQSDLPQIAAVVAVSIVAAFIGIWKYLKTQVEPKATSASTNSEIVAASFIDSRVLKELISVLTVNMEEYSRESRKMNRNRQELTQALEESTDAVLANTDATQNMHRFLRRHNPGGLDPIDDIK